MRCQILSVMMVLQRLLVNGFQTFGHDLCNQQIQTVETRAGLERLIQRWFVDQRAEIVR